MIVLNLGGSLPWGFPRGLPIFLGPYADSESYYYKQIDQVLKVNIKLSGDYKHWRTQGPKDPRTQGFKDQEPEDWRPKDWGPDNVRSSVSLSFMTEMQLVSMFLCQCVTVDYSEDQKIGEQFEIALSATNNAFGVHSDHIQDIAMSQARSIGIDSLTVQLCFDCYCATQLSTLWVFGFPVLRSLGLLVSQNYLTLEGFPRGLPRLLSSMNLTVVI